MDSTCIVLVDTGASVSLLPSTIAGRQLLQQMDESEQSRFHLRSVTGEQLSVLGYAEMDIVIGNIAARHNFTVANIDTGPILAADFLTQHKFIVDLERKRLSW